MTSWGRHVFSQICELITPWYYQCSIASYYHLPVISVRVQRYNAYMTGSLVYYVTSLIR